jgi:hypothetical protein
VIDDEIVINRSQQLKLSSKKREGNLKECVIAKKEKGIHPHFA